MDEQKKFFKSVRDAFGGESDEEKERRLKEAALKRIAQKSLQENVSDYFAKRLKG